MCEINIWAVIVAVIVSTVLAMIWYSPKVFGNAFMASLGIIPNEEDKKGMWKKIVAHLITTFVMVYVFSRISMMVGCGSVSETVALAITIWIGFFAMLGLSGVIWEKRSVKWFLISAGFDLVSIIVVAIVLSTW